MNTVTVSPEFGIIFPEEIRQDIGIQPGQKLEIFRVGEIIELAPVKPIQSLRGSLPGLDTTIHREADRP